MGYRQIIQLVISFFIYWITQVVFLRNIVVFDSAFIFIYIGFLLSLPFETTKPIALVLGFFMGIMIDLFYDSIGIHAAACVLMMFTRAYWLTLITPQGGYELGSSPTINDNGILWYLSYSVPLIFIHHFAIFYIEAGGFTMFFFTLGKVFYSLIITTTVLILVQLLFYSSSTRRT